MPSINMINNWQAASSFKKVIMRLYILFKWEVTYESGLFESGEIKVKKKISTILSTVWS